MIITDTAKADIKEAAAAGWYADLSNYNRVGVILVLGTTQLWRIRDGWQCADIVDGYFVRHRPYRTLTEALKGEEI